MKIGISTASLYPMHTEDALLTVAKLGIKNVEIFLNSVGEASPEGKIFSSMQDTIKHYGLNLLALHPFSSPLETLFLFSSYDRRVDEIMELYKRYFEAMSALGAGTGAGGGIFVVHGAIASAKCPNERYIERLSRLIRAGREAGVTVAQENVSYCRSGDIAFLEMLARELGDSAAFVLDIKQARRSGASPLEMLDSLGDKIVHLHLSDSNDTADCLPIGAGGFDFAELFARLKERGYKGDAVVELYRENYGDYSALADCVARLEKSL